MKADSMDAALEMAKRCPHLEIGTIEVAEVMAMQVSIVTPNCAHDTRVQLVNIAPPRYAMLTSDSCVKHLI